jgi:hypothetical protein
MNRSAEIPSRDWRQYLASLPDVDPPEVLWSRLQQRRRPPARPRSSRRAWAGGAIAAALALALVLLWPSPEVPMPEIRRVASSAAPLAATRADAGLRRLDDELALAYARNADEAELAALWQTRERLIDSLQGPSPALLARL